MSKPMTVGQLMEALSMYDPNLPVRTEGCDCDGDVNSVVLYYTDPTTKDNCVYLRR